MGPSWAFIRVHITVMLVPGNESLFPQKEMTFFALVGRFSWTDPGEERRGESCVLHIFLSFVELKKSVAFERLSRDSRCSNHISLWFQRRTRLGFNRRGGGIWSGVVRSFAFSESLWIVHGLRRLLNFFSEKRFLSGFEFAKLFQERIQQKNSRKSFTEWKPSLLWWGFCLRTSVDWCLLELLFHRIVEKKYSQTRKENTNGVPVVFLLGSQPQSLVTLLQESSLVLNAG